MNHSLPDWNIDGDLQTSLKKLKGPDHGLVELLWQNGQLVFHGQPHRKPGSNPSESNNVQKHDQPTLAACGSVGNSNNLIQDDETVSWIQYPVDDSFEKEFCSNFFSGIPSSNPMEADRHREFGEDSYAKFGSSYANKDVPSSQNSQFTANPMPPPRFQHPKLGGLGKNVSFSQSPAPVLGADLESSNAKFGGKGLSNMAQAEVRECSSMTVGSSHCGSNQVPTNDTYMSPASTSGVGAMGLSTGHLKDDARKAIPQRVRGDTEMLDQALTSSSGGSGTSYGRTYNQSTFGTESQKRKGRDGEDSECQSEAAELESPARNKPAQPSRTARRSRAAEVHNLSERRRRDRINEKMKALQELIPHSNKSDKASMLDEAIEYLKSLQLQLQMMWMGSGMAPMMLPGAQNYISRMGMGMGPPPLPAIRNPMHSPRVSLIDQAISMAPTPNQAAICPTPVLNPLNYQTQMQNSNFAEQYACYMALHQMQNASQQPMNIFNFGSGTGQQGHVMAPTPPAGNNGSSSSGRTTADETSIGKSG